MNLTNAKSINLSVVTDGLSPKNSALVACVLTNNSDNLELATTFYLDCDADFEKIELYAGLDEQEWAKNKLGPEEAKEKINEELDLFDIIYVYNIDFAKPFLETCLTQTNVNKLVDVNGLGTILASTRQKLSSVGEFEHVAVLNHEIGHILFHCPQKMSFHNLTKVFGLDSDDTPRPSYLVQAFRLKNMVKLIQEGANDENR